MKKEKKRQLTRKLDNNLKFTIKNEGILRFVKRHVFAQETDSMTRTFHNERLRFIMEMYSLTFTFMTFVFLVTVKLATADKNDIFVSKGKSWIADENFTEIIKSSFASSRCCNVFLTGW